MPHTPPSFFRHVAACNRHDLSRFYPFAVLGVKMGWIRQEIWPVLAKKRQFELSSAGVALTMTDEPDFNRLSSVFAEATALLSAHYGKPLRNEMYPVIAQWGDAPLAQVDRAAMPWFGLPAFGVHLNGFVRKPGGIHLWIGERAGDRLADPGKLDNITGGGQPIGLTLAQNLAKEAWEEAGIGPDLSARARAAGSISYMCERGEGLRNDTLFTYDLELPADFQPHNTDGEVAAFRLMPLPQIAQIIRTTDRFKFNCNLVIMDFLLRHGFAGIDGL